MFRNTFQSGLLSVLFSVGSKPLENWASQVKNGYIKRITDGDINSSVLELVGANVNTCFISCPADPAKTLGIKLPYLVMIIKNVRAPSHIPPTPKPLNPSSSLFSGFENIQLKHFFTFEVTVLDDKNTRRRFRASNYQLNTRVKPFICTMPMKLDEGWNQIQFNLADFTRRAYGTNYIETLRIQIHANCRIRRVYFSDRLYKEDELPRDFKILIRQPQLAGAAPAADRPAIEDDEEDGARGDEASAAPASAPQ